MRSGTERSVQLGGRINSTVQEAARRETCGVFQSFAMHIWWVAQADVQTVIGMLALNLMRDTLR